MRRRSVLAACGSGLAALAGCVGDGEPAGDGCGSDEPAAGSTPSHSDPREAFRHALERNADTDVQTVSLAGDHWTVEYASDACCGDPFAAHQAILARNFSSVRPANVSLNVTTFHECMDIHWRIPARLAREHRCGKIDTETYVSRVQNTTTRQNKC